MADSTPNQPDAVEEIEIEQPKSRRKGIIVVVLLVVVLVAVGLWWRSTFTEDTDDAQVNGHLIQVSARVGGQVAKVDVEENQVVKAGDVIAELDPRDYQVAVENAEAALASAQANAAAANVNVPITTVNTGSSLTSAGADVSGTMAGIEQAQKQLEAAHARVAQAQANSTKAQADLVRYKPLVEKDVISKQQYDAAVAAADASRAAVADAKANERRPAGRSAPCCSTPMRRWRWKDHRYCSCLGCAGIPNLEAPSHTCLSRRQLRQLPLLRLLKPKG